MAVLEGFHLGKLKIGPALVDKLFPKVRKIRQRASEEVSLLWFVCWCKPTQKGGLIRGTKDFALSCFSGMAQKKTSSSVIFPAVEPDFFY